MVDSWLVLYLHLVFLLLQVRSLAVEAEHGLPGLSEKAEAAEAALLAERSTLTAKRENAKTALKELEIAHTNAANKK